MSRIGTKPIQIPNGVTIEVDANNVVTVKGPKGRLSTSIARELTIEQSDGQLSVTRPNNQRRIRSQHGLARTLIDNCVKGVTEGHTKVLEVTGVGYRVLMQGKGLQLALGYSHPVAVDPIDGIAFEVYADEKTRVQQIKVSGIDKVSVGQVAADIRKLRKPDPYKGKGVRYRGETIKLKAGKRAGAKK